MRKRKYIGQSDPYYRTKEWRALRKLVLERDRYRCIVCGVPATHVDHIKRRKDGGSDELTNLRSLCAVHDGQAKERSNGKRGKFRQIGCDETGWPLSRSETEMGSKISFRNRDGVPRP